MKTYPRPEIAWFSSEMESKLSENDHKGGWQGCRFSYLFPRLREECDELLVSAQPLNLDTIAEAMTAEEARAVIRECADVANFAMMIADNIRLKTVATHPQPTERKRHGSTRHTPSHLGNATRL